MDWGKSESTIDFTAASEVARLDKPEEQRQLCQAGLQQQLGSDEVKQILQLHRRSGQSIQDCVVEILRLRPCVQRIHVFIGEVTSPDVRERLATISQADRDAAMRPGIKKAFPTLGKFGCRLGPERFTVAGADGLSTELVQGGRESEAAINVALAEAVSP